MIIDANILMAAPIKNSTTRKLLFEFSEELFMPEYILLELNKYRALIKRKMQIEDVDMFLHLLLKQVRILPKRELLPYHQEATRIIEAIDINDMPYIARHSRKTPLSGLTTKD